ncbi:cardiolipin synthase [Pelagibacterium luteolum]|uniref:Cardiolipin synthase n=1 Tax=Pelagibacterium luteolum TaxID=440168 RepID=A0A1G7WBD7_9HYPH|nr:cardiolipin synthase [Pelagibacterium luteolum]SDG69278.1 cardiolipin synthase [Pelagibacterium luteolum]
MDLLRAVIDNFSFLATLYVANYILAFVCVAREIMNSRTSQGTIAWLVSLLVLPFPTTIIYLIFGWKYFDDYAESQLHSGRSWRLSRSEDMRIVDRATSDDWPVLRKVAELPFLYGNAANLLVDGEETFGSIFDGVARAKTYVLVQFYIIRDDDLGRRFADLLIARAKDGVKVFVLYDDAGSTRLPHSYKARLRAAGVKIYGFNHRHTLLRVYGITRINYRNHRKNVVVDGLEAWVGGHNVGDEYLGKDKKLGRWRDTHVHVSGPAALACTLMFREDWHWSTGEDLPIKYPSEIPTPGDQPILVMPTGPADKLEDCAIAFTEVISRARERLWIVSPYFVPGIEIQTALYAASLRGVDVRILLPRKPDHMIVWLASYAHADQMVAHGIKIHRYEQGFLHQKVILVDDQIAGIGTVNFDYRSFNINFEATLWFTHKDMIENVEKMLETDFEASYLTTERNLQRRNFFFRLACQGARLFSPIL